MNISKIKKDEEEKTRKRNTNRNKWPKPHIKWILNKQTGAGWREWELSEVALGRGIWTISGLHNLNKCWTLGSGVFSQRRRLFSVAHSGSWVSQCGRREYKHAEERQLMNLLSWIVTGGISVSSLAHMHPSHRRWWQGVIWRVLCGMCSVVCVVWCVVGVVWCVVGVVWWVCAQRHPFPSSVCERPTSNEHIQHTEFAF